MKQLEIEAKKELYSGGISLYSCCMYKDSKVEERQATFGILFADHGIEKVNCIGNLVCRSWD
jgi:hypothetical protein